MYLLRIDRGGCAQHVVFLTELPLTNRSLRNLDNQFWAKLANLVQANAEIHTKPTLSAILKPSLCTPPTMRTVGGRV